MSETLDILFGSRTKTRLLRFFLLNPDREYALDDIIRKNMISKPDGVKELSSLERIKFIIKRRRAGKRFFMLNSQFSFYPELRGLIVKSNIYPQSNSLGKIKNIGDVKLALVSGTFLNYPKSKVDLLVVADNVSRVRLKNVMNNLEAEIGKEVSYALMTSEELKYRMNMMDRFLMGFLEGPHDEIINKVPILKRFTARIGNR